MKLKSRKVSSISMIVDVCWLRLFSPYSSIVDRTTNSRLVPKKQALIGINGNVVSVENKSVGYIKIHEGLVHTTVS